MIKSFNNLDNLIAVGIITNVHGIKGMVKVKSFTDNADQLFEYEPLFDKDGNVIEINKQGIAKELYLASVKGVTDRNQAELLKGTELFINQNQLPELEQGEYYNCNIIGLDVMDKHNNKIGTVIDMHNYGGGDLVDVKFNDSKESELFLFANDVVEVNIEENFLVLEKPSFVGGKKEEEEYV